ncbi:MAG: sporulation integral membrane protein YtvI [Clostridia bacterium]|nr:sporulation integral membrane protein YtvI [Clostridia bacterium]MBR5266314.1 sporulation integral membrane protein YtvI [Clostridia bacterium]
MKLHENKHISFFILVGYALVAYFGARFFFNTIFPWTVPFIISVIMTAIIEKPVSQLEKKKVPRKVAALVCTLLYITLFGTAIYLLVALCISEGKNLIAALPGFLASLPERFSDTMAQLDGIFERLPLEKIGIQETSVSDLLSSVSLPNFSASSIVSPLFKMAVSLPTVILSTVFIFVSTYFMTSERRVIVRFIKKQLPPKMLEVLFEIRRFLVSSVLKWIKAQSIIICITFCELLISFNVQKLPYAFLLAMCIAIIDALPILGVGTVLIPWSLVCLVTGDYFHAVGMIATYGVVLVIRNAVEPKIVGMHIGLHPFVSLLSIYFGYRIAGFGGMFLVPVVVLLLCKLQELDVIRFYKE